MLEGERGGAQNEAAVQARKRAEQPHLRSAAELVDWLPAEKVVVPPSAVESVDWHGKRVAVRKPRYGIVTDVIFSEQGKAKRLSAALFERGDRALRPL